MDKHTEAAHAEHQEQADREREREREGEREGERDRFCLIQLHKEHIRTALNYETHNDCCGAVCNRQPPPRRGKPLKCEGVMFCPETMADIQLSELCFTGLRSSLRDIYCEL
ncbi:Hypothetical predicted protein [Scomber scombrus]|uniref:Uncharacterized protein n=1 Tax=Scomber scombrus TaxID=13677 RepID=A0AAV1PSY2_SCOSC